MSISSYFYQAQSFRSASTATYLDTVSLGLLANDGTNSPILVRVFDGLYPGIGTPIATLNGPSNPGTGLISYAAISPVLLEADTTYWIVAYAYGAAYGWRIADEEPTTGTDSGRRMYGGTWDAGPGDFVMKVEVIPEISVSALFALSSLSLVCVRRRSQNRITEQAVAPNDR